MTRTVLFLKLILILLTSLFQDAQPTQAIGAAQSALLGFADFQRSVQSSESDVLRGVYVPNLFALPVIQQPADNSYYVSKREGEITQFSIAAQYGNIGLLAHNNLSGRYFSQLTIGQEVRLVYGDGRTEYFVVTQLLRFQALEPKSISSSFRNLEGSETLTAGEMFNRAYLGDRHAVFQTCIGAHGNPSWGRLFVIALPQE